MSVSNMDTSIGLNYGQFSLSQRSQRAHIHLVPDHLQSTDTIIGTLGHSALSLVWV